MIVNGKAKLQRIEISNYIEIFDVDLLVSEGGRVCAVWTYCIVRTW